MFESLFRAVKISVKHLDFISNPSSSADWCNQEAVARGVEWLFVDGFLLETRLGDRLNNGYTEINRDRYAHQSLLTVLQPEHRSGLFLGYVSPLPLVLPLARDGSEGFVPNLTPQQQQRYRFRSAVPL